jgi:hypothetical protein
MCPKAKTVRRDVRITAQQRDPADLRRLAKALIAQVRAQPTDTTADNFEGGDEDKSDEH